jgi:hypothetical protein
MPLTWKAETLYMEWCLECHRHPENFLRPRENVFDVGWQPAENQQSIGRQLVNEYNLAPANVLSDCVICHR